MELYSLKCGRNDGSVAARIKLGHYFGRVEKGKFTKDESLIFRPC